MQYFSDRENGVQPRIVNDIPPNVWEAIIGFIDSLIDKGYFGENFPENCPDGAGCIGTNEKLFNVALLAEIPNIDWSKYSKLSSAGYRRPSYDDLPLQPNYLDVLDLLEFCFQNIGAPKYGSYHQFFDHNHINYFDKDEGRSLFIETINRYFSRNRVAYELNNNGEVVRVLNSGLQCLIKNIILPIEQELKNLLVSGNKRIYDANVSVRYEALKDLWDFWERVKTTFNPSVNKKTSMLSLLDAMSESSEFRDLLEEEAKKLTEIGNAFFIRHSEVTQIKLTDSEHIEYLYHRLLSIINLIISKTAP